MRTILTVVVLVVVALAVAGGCSQQGSTSVEEQAKTAGEGRGAQGHAPETATTVEQPAKPPQSVRSFDVGPSGEHIEGDVDYEQKPPAGGLHSPIWQNCGYYDQPVRDETAVHSLEHGAVWITYSPDLPQDQVEVLRDLAHSNSYVLVSPYSGLDSPVVASAWGKQLKLKRANDPNLERFIQAYSQGPQTPELGAPCTGGVGRPG